MRGRSARLLAVLLALALVGASCTRDDDDDGGETEAGDEETEAAAIPTEDCPTDPTAEIEGDSIKLVSSFPQSGLTAAFSEIARGWRAYFQMVNDEGGVEIGERTFTIEWEDRDDEYNAARTASNIQEMVGPEGDQAFAAFSVVGTANNLAIRDTLHDLCVPNLFAATGSPAWGNPDYPWMIGSTLSPYTLEGYMFARLLEEEDPDATVAMLVQDDDFGRAYEEGFRQAIEGTDIEVVEVQSYETGASEVAAQVTSLAATDATAFFNGGTLLACPDALSQAAQNNWEPITWVSGTCISKTLMGIAGAAADGVYSGSNLMEPLNPQWDDNEAMQQYRDTVAEYEPEADVENGIVAYGWTQAALLVEALENAEAPTRLAVMESIRNLDGVSDLGVLLPGVSISTSPDDAYMGETLQLAQYNFQGENERNFFELLDEPVDFEGETAELTPEDLITG